MSVTSKQEKRRLPLATQILIALVLAILVGIGMTGCPDIASSYIKPFGTIFLNLLKFIVGPIVLFSIISGIISTSDVRKVGSIGVKTVAYYICTTACAISIGLLVASVCKGFFPALATTDLAYEAAEGQSFMDTLVGFFPSNFITPLSEAVMLQIIVMALIIGFAIVLLGEGAGIMPQIIESCTNVFMKCMDMILALSPIGVFCLLCPVVAVNGPAILGSLAAVLAVAYACYILHAVLVYSLAARAIGGMSPIQFFKGMWPAIIFAFSSASSVGTLPINMECTQKLGVPKAISSFVLPLGATINMDGTAIYQGVCAIFIASCYGIDLTLGQMVTIVLTATVASIGTAGVPGSGMVMLSMVLVSVGLPVDGIALVAGVDRIFDMGRTVVNITGDASCCVVVGNLEKKREARKIRKAEKQAA